MFVWLLLATRFDVLSGVTVPPEVESWRFTCDFDRVLLSSWEHGVLQLNCTKLLVEAGWLGNFRFTGYPKKLSRCAPVKSRFRQVHGVWGRSFPKHRFPVVSRLPTVASHKGTAVLNLTGPWG